METVGGPATWHKLAVVSVCVCVCVCVCGGGVQTCKNVSRKIKSQNTIRSRKKKAEARMTASILKN